MTTPRFHSSVNPSPHGAPGQWLSISRSYWITPSCPQVSRSNKSIPQTRCYSPRPHFSEINQTGNQSKLPCQTLRQLLSSKNNSVKCSRRCGQASVHCQTVRSHCFL